ncbi:MAG TPA: PAS domain S-box protein, partial [Flavisolibacter sp.]|nr:PAS domain S-box protein [Flavisolibacter sp.]
IGTVVDVHEEKIGEEALRKTTADLEVATNSAQVGTWLYDVQNGTLQWSALHKRMWGFDDSRSDLHYEDWYNVILPGDKEIAFQQIEHARLHRSQYEAIYRIRRASDGEVRWMRSSGRYFYNSAGEASTLTGVTTDITEHKKAEEALLASEDRYQNFVRRSSEGIWRIEMEVPVPVILSVESQIELFFRHAYLAECNDAMARMYGYQHSAELLGMRLADFFPSDADTTSYFTYFITSGYRVQNAESRELTKTGESKYFSNNLIGIVEDGMLVRAWGTQRDITAQREAEEKIRESEERFRTLVETLPQLVWITDTQGTQLYTSRKWKDYTGVEPSTESWSEIVHPDDASGVMQSWSESLTTGKNLNYEVRLKNKEGQFRWFRTTGSAVKDSAGTIKQWTGVCTDIHDEKTLAQKLEELVAERTRQLQQSNEDLQQFAHVASHDLKEPVRKVKTFVSRLEDELQERLDDRTRLYLSKVQSATDRMFTMIDGVLTYSTINAQSQVPEVVDLNEVLNNIVTDIEVAIQQKKASISYRNLPQVEGAPVLLYQLFYNLVNNSIKFAKPGVPPVVIITSQTERRQNEDFTQITVQDNGIGFEPQQAKAIFESFTRLNSKDKFEGTGLGLALCKKIAERHGGSITAVGQFKQGAAFTVLLPLKQSKVNI